MVADPAPPRNRREGELGLVNPGQRQRRYFDSGYLGYEAAEGIDCIWEHHISDLDPLGI
jgi:hypothetical protein